MGSIDKVYVVEWSDGKCSERLSEKERDLRIEYSQRQFEVFKIMAQYHNTIALTSKDEKEVRDALEYMRNHIELMRECNEGIVALQNAKPTLERY